MTPRRLHLAALAGAGLLAACYTSPPPEATPQATSPFGAEVTMWLADRRTVKGELLEVTDTTVMLLSRTTGRVAVARFPSIRSVEFSVVEAVFFTGRGNPGARALEGARLRARFPYGMSPAVRAALLAKAGQSAPDTLAASPTS
jgi:hypothetical protein